MTQNSLYINHIRLSDVGGFEDMSISFGRGLNVICGPNGVGKTTILDAVGSAFVANYGLQSIRRRAGTNEGKISFDASFNGSIYQNTGKVTGFEERDHSIPFGTNGAAATQLIYVKSNRDIAYTRLSGVLRDNEKRETEYQLSAMQGIDVSDVKQWFSNRYLMRPHGEHWPQYQHDNYETASGFFSLLDSTVRLSHVDSSEFEIYLDTRSGRIPFEYMSAGFRTSYGLIFGILKEIEFRRLKVSAQDFSGIILVDELDLHLHPTWHGPMLRALEAAYPNAQIIVSTHSPHMIQYAKMDSLIILPRDGVEPRNLEGVDPEYGLIGWTVEEILRDVMGMDDPRPPEFAQMMTRYENAVTLRDEKTIKHMKSRIFRALHPSSIVRQIIEIESL